jgi:BlaI family transcriptional regulator, penicillinase repressor
MATFPAITEAEWKVMKVLWNKSPQPAYDVARALADTEHWHPNTVKSLLNRLREKEVLGIKKYKNLYLYYPLLQESDYLQRASDSFLDRFFGGSAKSLLVHFAERRKLSPEDWKELRCILRKKK